MIQHPAGHQMICNSKNNTFFSCDLDLDPMTLIHKHKMKILKMCLQTKNELYVKDQSIIS